MANSTTNLDNIQSNAVDKEAEANELIDAASPATSFGRRALSSSGLTFGLYGGTLYNDGVATQVSNTTVSLTASTTNFVELQKNGTRSTNTTAFAADRIPLYTVVTGASTVTSYTDHRTGSYNFGGRAVKAMADANQTLTHAEARCSVVECTGALTAQRNLTIPHLPRPLLIANDTTGGFGVQAIGASGTGYVVANAKVAVVWSDGTNIRGATFV